MSKITIAIPIYNAEPYVERALRSALDQTYRDIEILIIDDKGKDKSMDVVAKVAAEHPRGECVRIIDHGTNRGTGATRNSAIDNASGEFLMFLDSDDEITIDCAQKLYDALMSLPGADFSGANFKYIVGDKKINYRPQFSRREELKSRDEIMDFYFKTNTRATLALWNQLYHISFLRDNKIRCIEEHITEDILFSHQLRLYASKIVLIPDCTYLYYFIPGSTMHKLYQSSHKQLFAKEINIIIERLIDYNNRLAERKHDRQMNDSVLRVFFFYAKRLLARRDKTTLSDVRKTFRVIKKQVKNGGCDRELYFWAALLCRFPFLFRIRQIKFYFREMLTGNPNA